MHVLEKCLLFAGNNCLHELRHLSPANFVGRRQIRKEGLRPALVAYEDILERGEGTFWNPRGIAMFGMQFRLFDDQLLSE